ncbi:hypothetical protein K5I04_03675 [Murdochiella sp. Marseille-P8839]|nr:hypothetical protein [Murdochiella sp. Marseille-P8839]
MGKRFRFEFARSLPFFLTLVLGGTIYWLLMRQLLMHPEALFMFPILLPLLIGLAFVVASVVYVIVNVSRELSKPSGLLTFLTPLAPWKMMMAKWLNFMVSFGLSFLVMRFLLVLFPLAGNDFPGDMEIIASLAESHHPVNVPFFFLIGMSALSGLIFVLRWTLVLALVFWVLGWTEMLASRSILRWGKFPLRVVSFLAALFVLDEAGAFLASLLPWCINVESFQLFRPMNVVPIHFTLESAAGFERGIGLGESLYSTAIPVVLFVFLLLAIIFFLWRAQAYWKKIDR